MMYVIFSLMGYYVETEVRTATGRIDMVMKTDDTVYLFELKLNRSAEEALAQIERKNYSSKFFLSDLPVVKVGINFSNEERTITDWKVARE